MRKWGVSWGGPLFRVGQSPNGQWWGYFNILGFRFFRYFDVNGKRRYTRNQQNIPGYYQQSPMPQSQNSHLPGTAHTVQSNSQPQSHQVNTTGTPLESANDKILEQIKNQQAPDSTN